MGFSRREYWSGLPFPSPGDLPDPGIKPVYPTLQADALTSEPPATLGDNDVSIQCRFISLTNTPLLCVMLIVQKAVCGLGGRRVWEFSLLSTQFSCEPKTSVKIKFIKNKSKTQARKTFVIYTVVKEWIF